MEEGSTWIEIYPMGQRRWTQPMDVLGGSIYVMGGRGNPAHRSNERFTPNSWSYIADQYAGDEVVGSCIAADEEANVIYQFGGYAWNVGYLNRIVKYYPSSNSWGSWQASYAGLLLF